MLFWHLPNIRLGPLTTTPLYIMCLHLILTTDEMNFTSTNPDENVSAVETKGDNGGLGSLFQMAGQVGRAMGQLVQVMAIDQDGLGNEPGLLRSGEVLEPGPATGTKDDQIGFSLQVTALLIH
ncbi:unnamed protein product [Protopolystoma xenopodis]|uniref:Uncharacterized protein n=1 Tax=Protopolystoma xenopodis TaxID=117903 RepID=A0A448X8A0_9PLAT|nr:unnamed protein product [Protopolystoma xenopodis]